MRFRNDSKNLKILLVLAISITLISGLSATYAFFVYRGTGSNVSLEAGDISIDFASGSNSLEVSNSYPVSDDTGMVLPYYSDFTISGTTSEISIKYEIQIVPNKGNTIDEQYVKVYLTDQDDNSITGVRLYDSLENATYNESGKTVYSAYMTSSEVKQFRLRVWIDQSYETTTGQDFGFSVYLYAMNDKVPAFTDTLTETLALTEPDVDGTRFVTGNSTSIASATSNDLSKTKPSILLKDNNDIIDKTVKVESGADINNYVLYSGILWRVVSIDKDGNIKLITQDNITERAWDSDLSDDTIDIMEWLNNDFLSTILKPNELLVNATWDYTEYEDYPNASTEKITPTDTISNKKVGLINVYEFTKVRYGSNLGINHFLNNGKYWWSMSTYGYDSTENILGIWIITGGGVDNDCYWSYDSYGIRPSVVLKAGITNSGGTGSSTSPYVIS